MNVFVWFDGFWLSSLHCALLHLLSVVCVVHHGPPPPCVCWMLFVFISFALCVFYNTQQPCTAITWQALEDFICSHSLFWVTGFLPHDLQFLVWTPCSMPTGPAEPPIHTWPAPRPLSASIITDIGTPQGCVLSPVFYHKDKIILKFRDDTAVKGRITGVDEAIYRREAASLMS